MTATANPAVGVDGGVVTDPGQRRKILAAMCLALMAVIASVSILNVAQQDLALDLGASQGTVLWILNAYTLALAGLLLPIGAIGDRWGRKPVLVSGLVLFGLATLLCSVANSSELLITGRALAGAAAAMIMPVTLSVLTSSFPPEERGQAIGVWAGVAGAGGIIGMFVAAFMVDVATWRWAFILPGVLVVAAFAATLKAVPNSREHSEHRFDTVGSILSAVAIGALVLGIHEGPERGWSDTLTVAGLIVGGVSLVLFVVWELRQHEPLLDMRAFSNRGLAAGSFTITLVFAVLFGIFLVLFPFLQGVLGWSALRSAVAMLPMAAVMMPTSTFAPRIAKRVGTRNTMLFGLVLISGGLALLAAMASVEGGYWSILPGLLVMGLGMGFTMTPSTEAITESLPAEKQGVASALNDTTREVGGALGVALLGSMVTAGYRSAIHDTVVTLPPELGEYVDEGFANGLGAVSQGAQSGAIDPQTAGSLVDRIQHAFVDGWTGAMWLGVAIVAAAFVFVLVRGPRRSDLQVLDAAVDGGAGATGSVERGELEVDTVPA